MDGDRGVKCWQGKLTSAFRYEAQENQVSLINLGLISLSPNIDRSKLYITDNVVEYLRGKLGECHVPGLCLGVTSHYCPYSFRTVIKVMMRIQKHRKKKGELEP